MVTVEVWSELLAPVVSQPLEARSVLALSGLSVYPPDHMVYQPQTPEPSNKGSRQFPVSQPSRSPHALPTRH